MNMPLVTADTVVSCCFVKKIVEGKEISIPVRHVRRNVVLTYLDGNFQGTEVVFSTYMNRGKMRFKDSRDKNSSSTPHEILREMKRLLGINRKQSLQLLSGMKTPEEMGLA